MVRSIENSPPKSTQETAIYIVSQIILRELRP